MDTRGPHRLRLAPAGPDADRGPHVALGLAPLPRPRQHATLAPAPRPAAQRLARGRPTHAHATPRRARAPTGRPGALPVTPTPRPRPGARAPGSASSAPPRPVALITGATRPGRVGLACALRLARAGCDLIITSRTPRDADARRAVSSIRRAGAHTASCLALDPADLASIDTRAAAIVRSHPRIDVLVHNASRYAPSPLETLDATAAADFFHANALGPLLLTRALLPALRRSTLPHGGAVVCFADIHAMGPAGRPRPDHIAYAMSKAAMTEWALALARQLAPAVRVNLVAPGVVAFPQRGPESDDGFQARYLSRVPLGRPGTPEDAAEAVAFLALHAGYVTGHVLRLDGGRSLT
ncbi:MAG: hypothetical protein C0475_00355 [Planctomyces sp.]|nr:hypothetical protein [Planctomyces sp.]